MRPDAYPLHHHLHLPSSTFANNNNNNARVTPLAFESLPSAANPHLARLPSAAQVSGIVLSPSAVPLSPCNNNNSNNIPLPSNNNNSKSLPPWQPSFSDNGKVAPGNINISINNIVSRNHILESHDMSPAAISKNGVQYQQTPSPSHSFDFPRVPHQPNSPAVIPSPPYPVHSVALYGQVFSAITKMNNPNPSNGNNALLPRTPRADKRDSPQRQRRNQHVQQQHQVHTSNITISHSQRHHPQHDHEPFRLQSVPSAYRDNLSIGNNPRLNKRPDQDQNANALRYQLPIEHHLSRIDSLLQPSAPPLIHHEHEPIIQQQLSRVQREQDHRSAQPRQTTNAALQLQLPAPHSQIDNTYGFPVHSSPTHDSSVLRKAAANVNNTELLPWDQPSPSQGHHAHSDVTHPNPLVSNSSFPPVQLFDLALDMRQSSNRESNNSSNTITNNNNNNNVSLPLPLASLNNAVSLSNLQRNNNNASNTVHHQAAALPSPSPSQERQQSIVKPRNQELSLTIPGGTSVIAKDNIESNAVASANQQRNESEKNGRDRQRGRKRKSTANIQNVKQGMLRTGDGENKPMVKNRDLGIQPASALATAPRLQNNTAAKLANGSGPRKRVRRKNRDVNEADTATKRQEELETSNNNSNSGAIIIHCPYCKAIFDMKRTRDMHVRTIHEKSFPCDKCPSLFKTKSDANRHMRIVHEGIRPFSCDACPATFAERGKLRRHKNTVHEKLRPFSCQVCNATFGERGNRNQHQSSRHAGFALANSNNNTNSNNNNINSPKAITNS